MKGLGLHRWRRMSLTGQDTRTGKPPLFRRNNRGEESEHESFFFNLPMKGLEPP